MKKPKTLFKINGKMDGTEIGLGLYMRFMNCMMINMTAGQKRITISINKDTFERLEMKRGLIPRSTFIDNILSKTLIPKEEQPK